MADPSLIASTPTPKNIWNDGEVLDQAGGVPAPFMVIAAATVAAAVGELTNNESNITAALPCKIVLDLGA